MKHTPGPWNHLWQAGEYLIDAPTETDIGMKVVCSVNARVAWAEAEANARLIAAAPDLYDAVKGALAALSQPHTYPADVEAAKTFLRAALENTHLHDNQDSPK